MFANNPVNSEPSSTEMFAMTNAITTITAAMLLFATLVHGDGIKFKAKPIFIQSLTTPELNLSCSGTGEGRAINIVMRKEGKVIAAVTDNMAAAAHGQGNQHQGVVSGDINPRAGELGHLQITWAQPKDDEHTGNYSCQIQTIHGFEHNTLKKDVKVIADSIDSIHELVDYVHGLHNDVIQLERELDTRVVFTAALSHTGRVDKSETVVFDNVITGNTRHDYDRSTGVFTAPVSGYYKVDVNLMTQKHGYASWEVEVNSKPVLWSFAHDILNSQSGSNSAVLRMTKGDKLRVVAKEDSDYNGNNACTLSAHLLSLI